MISLGYLQKEFGIKGGLVARFYNDKDQHNALSLNQTIMLRKNDIDKYVVISSLLGHNKIFFANINDPNEAKALVGYEILVDRLSLPKLDNDEIYLVDLLAYQVIDNKQALGLVKGFASNNAQILLKVKTADGMVSIPLVKPLISNIDDEEKIIYTDLPDGFLTFMTETIS